MIACFNCVKLHSCNAGKSYGIISTGLYTDSLDNFMFLPFYGNLDNIDEVMGYLLTVDEFIAWCESRLI